MKRLSLLAGAVALALSCSPAFAAIGTPTFLGKFDNAAASPNCNSVSTCTITTTADSCGGGSCTGYMIVCHVVWNINSTAGTLTDQVGNTYTALTKQSGAAALADQFYYVLNPTDLPSGDTVTWTSTGAPRMAMGCFSANGFTSSPFDNQASLVTGTTATASAISPAPSGSPSSTNSEIIIGWMGSGAYSGTTRLCTQPGSFNALTKLGNASNGDAGLCWGYQIVTSTSAVGYPVVTAISGATYNAGEAIFTSGAPGGGCPRTRSLLGVGC